MPSDDMLSDGAAVYTPGVSQRRSGSTTYDLHDQLGTTTKQTSASASVTATRTYDAFGTLVASTGTPRGPFGFAAASGYQEDGDSGLKLLGHRYYDASTGRFLTRDPIKDGRNWYAYCANNPLERADPTGHDWWNPTTWNDSWKRGAGHALTAGLAVLAIAALPATLTGVLVGGVIVVAVGGVNNLIDGATPSASPWAGPIGDGIGGVSGGINSVLRPPPRLWGEMTILEKFVDSGVLRK